MYDKRLFDSENKLVRDLRKYMANVADRRVFIKRNVAGRVVAFALMERVGRKYTFMGSIGLGCVCMFVSIYDNSITRKIMYCIGKVTIT